MKHLLSVILAMSVTCVSHAGLIIYSHNTAGRLVSVTYTNGLTQAFTYDNAGNLTQNVTTIPGPDTDTDADGLVDTWELQYFGSLIRNGAGDFDNDGFIDFNEFLAGTDPTSALSLLRIVPTPQLSSGVTIQWESVFGKSYRLQYKDDLSAAHWSDIAGNVTANSDISSKIDPTPPSQNNRYYRVILVP